jgi:hypothetical protein
MKHLYKPFFKSFLFLGTFLLTAVSVQAQQVSAVPGGPFNQATSWVNGVPTNKEGVLTISVDSEIIHHGDFSWNQKVVVDGTFNIVGNYTVGHGGVEVTGSLFIDGVLSQGNGGATLTVKNGGRVVVQSVTATHPIRVEAGGELIVNGDYLNSQPIHIEEGGRLYIAGDYGVNNNYNNGVLVNYGDAVVLGAFYTFAGSGLSVLGYGVLDIGGDLNAKQAVKVDPNAVLLVRGSVYYEGWQSGMFIDGTMVVAEDFKVTNGNISATGKVVVGGAFTFEGGGFSSPNQQDSGEANLYLLDGDAEHFYIDYTHGSNQFDNKSGDFSDFELHEGGSDLWDWVASVLPDVVNPGQSNRVYKWVGALNSDWYNRVNWNGRLPGYGVKVLIQAGGFMPVIKFEDGLIELKDLTIEADANLTLNPGGKLTVKGDLSVADEGALIMKNTTEVNGLASLIVEGAITGAARAEGKKGEVTIELEFPYDEWYYVSQPIKDAKSDIYGVWNEDGSFNTNEGWVNVHRANRWYRIGGGVDIAQLEGVSNKYRPADGSNHVVSYVGRLNNEAIARSYSNRQYYLFGNPYPSSINWQDDKGWERNNIGATLWYRTRVNGSMTFVTYNRSADPGARAAIYPDNERIDADAEAQLALIPPLQSAWMASLGNSSVSITKEAQQHTPEGAFLKSSSAATSNVVRITAENATSRDGAVLYFSANALEGLDKGDSEKMFNEPVEIPEVYTRVGSKAVAINGLPELKEDVRTIPLSVRNRTRGEVSLNFDMSLYSGEHEVYFEDKETGAFLNVSRMPSYTYMPDVLGDNHERFALHFYKVVTGIESPSAEEEDAGSAIQIRNVGNKVMVSASMELVQERPGRIEVYTIEGHKVSELPAQSSRTLVFLPSESGVYIVRATFGQRVKSERVMVTVK